MTDVRTHGRTKLVVKLLSRLKIFLIESESSDVLILILWLSPNEIAGMAMAMASGDNIKDACYSSNLNKTWT